MGVSISNFYLNIKPWKLTQKVLIFISLGLCLAGVLFHSLGLYNIVFYLFVSTLIVILISILEIYSAFKGINNQTQEIEAYIYYMLESDVPYYKKLEIYENFVKDWKKTVELQDKQSYENSLDIFKKCMRAVWAYRKKDSLEVIQTQCYNMAYCLLGSEKRTSKGKGIELIQKIYSEISNMTYNLSDTDKSYLNQNRIEFSLFSEIKDELLQSIDELNVEDVEKRFQFGNLVNSILISSSFFRYDDKCQEKNNKKKESYGYNLQYEVSTLGEFSRNIGKYLRKQNDKNNIINQDIWANVLNDWRLFLAIDIPEDMKEFYLKNEVYIYFNYCYGMLINGQENIIKKGLYFTGIKNCVRLENKYQVLFYLTVHCYIYYLAIREDDSCVSLNVRQSAINILEDREVKEIFYNFLERLSTYFEWLNLDMFNQMYLILNTFELFPECGHGIVVKQKIIEYVISDFYLFLILFLSQEFFSPELLQRNIDDMRAFRYVSDGNEENTKNILFELYRKMCIDNKTENEMHDEVGLMYANLESLVKKKQKERYTKLAKEAQDNYETNINEGEICEKIRNDTMSDIKQKFAPILIDEDSQNEIIEVDLLKLIDWTSSIGTKNSTNGYYSYMEGMFLLNIVKFLEQKNVVEFKNRFDDFKNDEEFMEYLKLNKLHVILGSQYIMKNREYKFSNVYKKIMEDYETIYTAVVREGIALKNNSIQVCLHSINVTINSSSIEEEKVRIDEKTGKYSYSITNGLPIDFDEDELREFLYNNRKVIKIKAKMSININEKICGTIFVNRQKI